ncbi:MAG: SurA N-terminal domain-containing protein [Cyanobacteria bacterium P01_H01_bin.74]
MNTLKRVVLSGIIVGFITFSGCANNAGLNTKVATVNGAVITKAAYEKAYSEIEKAFQLGNATEEQKAAMADTLKQMTMNKLILQQLVQSAAEKAGLSVSEEDIKAYKDENINSKPELKEQFTAFLKQNSMTESDFDAMLKDNLLMEKFMTLKGGDKVNISDSEAKTFYDSHKAQFDLPFRIHAKHILLKAIVPEIKKEIESKNEKISDDDLNKAIAEKKAAIKQKADTLYTQVIASPEKFETFAKENSEDKVSAINGGDLGDMAQSSVDPKFWGAAEKTPVGKIHEGVVESQFGYHIIKVVDTKPEHQMTLTEASPVIKQQLGMQKKQAFIQSWLDDQKAQAEIVIEPDYQTEAEKMKAKAKVDAEKAEAKAMDNQKADIAAPTKNALPESQKADQQNTKKQNALMQSKAPTQNAVTQNPEPERGH